MTRDEALQAGADMALAAVTELVHATDPDGVAAVTILHADLRLDRTPLGPRACGAIGFLAVHLADTLVQLAEATGRPASDVVGELGLRWAQTKQSRSKR